MPRGAKFHIGQVGTAAADVLPVNAHRVALIISCGPAQTVNLSFGEDAEVFKGIKIISPMNPLILTKELLGDVICQRLSGITSPGAAQIPIVEISET